MKKLPPKTCLVRLVAPGAKACGPYLAGEIYNVAEAEAQRLVRLKGFEQLDDAPQLAAGKED